MPWKVFALFKATAARIPGSAVPVNNWVAENTEGMITELVTDDLIMDPLVKALLLNAVYFKGDWLHPFNPRHTVVGSFDTPSGPCPCRMMKLTREVPFQQNELGSAVALPYQGESVRAIIILPAKPGLAGAAELCMALSESDGEAWQAMRTGYVSTRVALSIPRFRLEYGVEDISRELSSMGLAPLFEKPGGFMRMGPWDDLMLTQVLLKTVVEVTEKGTEAAAASAAVMKRRCKPRPPREFTVDRPFLFAIETIMSGELLFIGLVSSPEFIGT